MKVRLTCGAGGGRGAVVWLIWLLGKVADQKVRRGQLDASGGIFLPLGDAGNGWRGLGLAVFGDLLVVYP